MNRSRSILSPSGTFNRVSQFAKRLFPAHVRLGCRQGVLALGLLASGCDLQASDPDVDAGGGDAVPDEHEEPAIYVQCQSVKPAIDFLDPLSGESRVIDGDLFSNFRLLLGSLAPELALDLIPESNLYSSTSQFCYWNAMLGNEPFDHCYLSPDIFPNPQSNFLVNWSRESGYGIDIAAVLVNVLPSPVVPCPVIGLDPNVQDEPDRRELNFDEFERSPYTPGAPCRSMDLGSFGSMYIQHHHSGVGDNTVETSLCVSAVNNDYIRGLLVQMFGAYPESLDIQFDLIESRLSDPNGFVNDGCFVFETTRDPTRRLSNDNANIELRFDARARRPSPELSDRSPSGYRTLNIENSYDYFTIGGGMNQALYLSCRDLDERPRVFEENLPIEIDHAMTEGVIYFIHKLVFAVRVINAIGSEDDDFVPLNVRDILLDHINIYPEIAEIPFVSRFLSGMDF